MSETKNDPDPGLPRLSQTETFVLALLIGKSELYGLEMVEQSGGRLKRGTIYVTLGRMQDKGFIESRKEPRQSPEVGIPRRLYSITGYGMRVLAAYEVAQENFANFAICGGIHE
jgi:PadR family transcriptional regulator, regulatory protein PadR